MIITEDTLTGLLTGYQAMFSTKFDAVQGLDGWRNLAAPVDSNMQIESYNWFGTVPKMENVTNRQPSRRGLERYNFSITNEEWQSTVEVQLAALERDQLNLITPRISQMASEAARHPGELVMNLFETPGNAFDGVAFFSNTRTLGDSANIDNNLSSSGVTIDKIQTDIGLARAAMRAFQDDRGRPMNLIPNAIVAPPALEMPFWQALNLSMGDGVISPTIPAGFGNGTLINGYFFFINPYLTDTADWYMLHIGSGPEEKPFIIQTEKRPELTADTDPNSRAVIEQHTFLYSAYGRYNAGVTDPRYAIKIA